MQLQRWMHMQALNVLLWLQTGHRLERQQQPAGLHCVPAGTALQLYSSACPARTCARSQKMVVLGLPCRISAAVRQPPAGAGAGAAAGEGEGLGAAAGEGEGLGEGEGEAGRPRPPPRGSDPITSAPRVSAPRGSLPT